MSSRTALSPVMSSPGRPRAERGGRPEGRPRLRRGVGRVNRRLLEAELARKSPVVEGRQRRRRRKSPRDSVPDTLSHSGSPDCDDGPGQAEEGDAFSAEVDCLSGITGSGRFARADWSAIMHRGSSWPRAGCHAARAAQAALARRVFACSLTIYRGSRRTVGIVIARGFPT